MDTVVERPVWSNLGVNELYQAVPEAPQLRHVISHIRDAINRGSWTEHEREALVTLGQARLLSTVVTVS